MWEWIVVPLSQHWYFFDQHLFFNYRSKKSVLTATAARHFAWYKALTKGYLQGNERGLNTEIEMTESVPGYLSSLVGSNALSSTVAKKWQYVLCNWSGRVASRSPVILFNRINAVPEEGDGVRYSQRANIIYGDGIAARSMQRSPCRWLKCIIIILN